MNCKDCKYSHDTGTALLCWGQRFAPPVDADHWCEGWKPKSVTPQTNADRIRAMSDEELAEWLANEKNCSWNDGFYGSEGISENDLLTWLKSPVEEEQT